MVSEFVSVIVIGIICVLFAVMSITFIINRRRHE